MTRSIAKNGFKQALKDFRLQKGLWSTIPDALVVEMLAGLGFDWMLFDMEHSPIDALTVLPLLQAVASYPVAPIVRPSSLNVAEIKKILDLGARNILVPYVRNVEEARLAADSVTYPPSGIRGVAGITRASGFGDIAGYHKSAREEICLILQIETLDAVDALEDMARVPGVDALFIGPSDLAASLGHPGEASHPEVKKVVLDSIRRVREAGLPPGILSLDRALIADAIEAGAVFYSEDYDLAALKRGIRERL